MRSESHIMHAPPSPPSMRLLVADDNPVSRMIAAGLAEKLGHVADVAADGEQALRMLAARRYDLVLMDCEMPRLDGYAACRRLREMETGAVRTPVVALSAAPDEEDRLACLQAGMDDFLQKPLSLDDLARTLARWHRSPASVTPDRSTGDTLEVVSHHFGSRYAELANLWLDDAPLRLSALRQAVVAGDNATAASTAHALSGGCASIGARALSEQCRQMELQAHSGTASNLDDTLSRIESGCAEVAGRLRRMLQSSITS